MFHHGKIIRKFQASPTVMVLDLNVPSLSTFDPGQWIDFVVKPYTWIGGFSIASSPRDLPTIRIAVKRSDHPPSTWVHEQSKVNDIVELQIGGTCTLIQQHQATADNMKPPPPAVFCAGGIGISPILSQYREFLHQRRQTVDIDATQSPSMFLYSVSTSEELVFGKELGELSLSTSWKPGHDRMVFSLTKTTDKLWDDAIVDEFPTIERCNGRILTKFLDEAPDNAIYYICGPPSMIDDAVSHLLERGVTDSCIKYEKWW